MDDYVGHCALPGCVVPIDNVPGRPVRRYCTAAHRAAARQARRASMQPDQHARLAETLPWLREPDPEPVLAQPVSPRRGASGPVRVIPVSATRPAPPPRRSLSARLGDHLPRRRRAIAVLGAAGILAGGYAVTSSQSTELAGPTQQTPQDESSDGWAARAQVTLTSVDRQLDTIAQTEAAWNAMPEHTTVGTPVSVGALIDRKALLERRKAALQSQLDSYRALARTKADLELCEQNLGAVEKALRDVPTTGAVSSPDEASALAALQEQRDLRIHQRDAKKLELARLEGNVEKAARAPLPDDGQQTNAVSDEVMDVIHNDGRGGGQPSTPTPGPNRPEVLASGRQGEHDQERQATTTSAPPDPRGARDQSAERRAGSEQQKGPVGEVVDTVGGVLGGGDGGDGKPDSKSAPAADKPAEKKPAEKKPAEKKPAEKSGVVGGVVGAVDGVTGVKDQGQEVGAPKASAAGTPAADRPANAAVPQQRTAPAPVRSATVQTPVPAGAAGSVSTPGAEMAMAIVNSVPGREIAAPAVEAAMRQAQQQPSGSQPVSQSSVSQSVSQPVSQPVPQPVSRTTPAHMTTVVEDPGASQKQSASHQQGSSTIDNGSSTTTVYSSGAGSSARTITTTSDGGGYATTTTKTSSNGSGDTSSYGSDSSGDHSSSPDRSN